MQRIGNVAIGVVYKSFKTYYKTTSIMFQFTAKNGSPTNAQFTSVLVLFTKLSCFKNLITLFNYCHHLIASLTAANSHAVHFVPDVF